MKVLVTGSNGFIGNNLRVHLSEREDIEVVTFSRDDDLDSLGSKLDGVDFVFHLAGVNRPKNVEDFARGNTDLTSVLCQEILHTKRLIPVVYTSSVQAELENPYGHSKKAAEQALVDFSEKSESPVYLFRLQNVFGKWCKPNYNSVVATFCHNVAHNLPIRVSDETATVRLIYVDNVVKHFISIMDGAPVQSGFSEIQPVYEVTVGDLAKKYNCLKILDKV